MSKKPVTHLDPEEIIDAEMQLEPRPLDAGTTTAPLSSTDSISHKEIAMKNTTRTNKSARTAKPTEDEIAAALEGTSEPLTFAEGDIRKVADATESKTFKIDDRAVIFFGGPRGFWRVEVFAAKGSHMISLTNAGDCYSVLNALTSYRNGAYPHAEVGLHLLKDAAELAKVGLGNDVGYVKHGYEGGHVSGINRIPVGSWATVNYHSGVLSVGRILTYTAQPEQVEGQAREYLPEYQQIANSTIRKHDGLDAFLMGYGFNLRPLAKGDEKASGSYRVAMRLAKAAEFLGAEVEASAEMVKEAVQKVVVRRDLAKSYQKAANPEKLAAVEVASFKTAEGADASYTDLVGKMVELWRGQVRVTTRMFDAGTAVYAKNFGLRVVPVVAA